MRKNVYFPATDEELLAEATADGSSMASVLHAALTEYVERRRPQVITTADPRLVGFRTVMVPVEDVIPTEPRPLKGTSMTTEPGTILLIPELKEPWRVALAAVGCANSEAAAAIMICDGGKRNVVICSRHPALKMGETVDLGITY
jgi:hypothetical protein